MDIESLERRMLFTKAPVFAATNLVSNDTTILPASRQDANLVNAWGLAAGPGTEWWIANNRTGTSTLYDGNGTPDTLTVTVPSTTGSSVAGAPTGVVYNGTNDFQVATNAPAQFLFDTEQGTISGWGPNADPTHAIVKVDNSASHADYTGLAMDTVGNSNFLLAANFASGKIEIYNSTFHTATLTDTFHDKKIPAGYSPFNVQNINGLIYVTYAALDTSNNHDIPGRGHGYVDIYLPNGILDRRLVKRGTLNSPWGVARFPGGFGRYTHDIAVGNLTDGVIQVFDSKTGVFQGDLKRSNGKVIRISGLWGLAFGNDGLAGASNELFYTAGPAHYVDGLFGKLDIASVTPTSTNPGDPGYIFPSSTSASSQLFGSDSIIDKNVDSGDASIL
jgi:uncharacterized protein (TIGR03118 family)